MRELLTGGAFCLVLFVGLRVADGPLATFITFAVAIVVATMVDDQVRPRRGWGE